MGKQRQRKNTLDKIFTNYGGAGLQERDENGSNKRSKSNGRNRDKLQTIKSKEKMSKTPSNSRGKKQPINNRKVATKTKVPIKQNGNRSNMRNNRNKGKMVNAKTPNNGQRNKGRTQNGSKRKVP